MGIDGGFVDMKCMLYQRKKKKRKNISKEEQAIFNAAMGKMMGYNDKLYSHIQATTSFDKKLSYSEECKNI